MESLFETAETLINWGSDDGTEAVLLKVIQVDGFWNAVVGIKHLAWGKYPAYYSGYPNRNETRKEALAFGIEDIRQFLKFNPLKYFDTVAFEVWAKEFDGDVVFF